MGISRITLHRKLTMTAGVSVSQFICQVRLKKALELLKQNAATISEIAYNCGFHSVTYFTKCFHDYYGYPPGEAKNQVTPEKTEAKEVKPTVKKRWVQVTVAAAVFVVVVVISSEVFFFRPFTKEKESAENTIAILPFVNDSGEEFAPFTTWMGIEIGNKLGKIENMLVVPQSTTENYRDSKKSNRDIARELMVDHLLRGRTIKTGNKILLNIDLLEAKTGNAVLTEMYERDLDETEEADLNRIFEICSDVVLQVSQALQTDLTEEKKVMVTKKSTKNPEALQNFQQGNQLLTLLNLSAQTSYLNDMRCISDAKKAFEKAIKLDSAYIDAYVKLAHIYITILPNYTSDLPLSHCYLDSGFVMTNKALMLDKNNFGATAFKRKYFLEKGMYDDAEKLNPLIDRGVKNAGYYQSMAADYITIHDYFHFVDAISKYYEFKPVDRPKETYIFNSEIWGYSCMGFPNLAKQRNLEKFKFINDTILYENTNMIIENNAGNYEKLIELNERNLKRFPNSIQFMNWEILILNFLQDYNNALKAIAKLENALKKTGDSLHLTNYIIGITFLKNGMPDKANAFFKEAIKRMEEEINYNDWNAKGYITHFNLARIYSVLNDRQKAIYYLGEMKKANYTFEYMIQEH
jgi:TolB-like protein/AraC-like DNA-binding protein